MTIESQLAQLQQAATEQTEASVQLANNITEGLQEIDQVKQDIAHTYQTVNQNNQALNDWQTQSGSVNLKDLNGNSHTLPTLKSLIADAQSVNPHPHVMTKAQFDALRDMRKQQYAGSGFVEWGKESIDENCNINDGIWQAISPERNTFFLGRSGKDVNSKGISLTDYPIAVVDGVSHKLENVACARSYIINKVRFPMAPDGTKTYDSASGTVTQHNDAATAFTAETATNKVITSRKDLVFLESWHEKIADKDIVYPLGNVQYGANNYKGITLRNNLVAQGYSAFGEWDADTKGHGVKWSSLTESQKAIFLGEPEHNIYYDPKAKAYIQVRYRVRVIEGPGDNWGYIADIKVTSTGPRLQYDASLNRVKPRGKLANVVTDLGNISSGLSGFFVGGSMQESYGLLPGKGCLQAINKTFSAVDIAIAEQGKCFALPIALVQRLNQGAYHPTYNPMGTGKLVNSAHNGWRSWHISEAKQSTAVKDYFTGYQSGGVSDVLGTIGSISGDERYSGRVDQYKFYDAIYAGQVTDLRLSANKLDKAEVLESTLRHAISNRLRGESKPLFTKIHQATIRNVGISGGGRWLKVTEYEQLKDVITDKRYACIYNATKNEVYYIAHIDRDAVYVSLDKLVQSLPLSYQNGGKELSTPTPEVDDLLYVLDAFELSASFHETPQIDLFGHPENLLQQFPDGVQGLWNETIGSGSEYQLIPINHITEQTATTMIGREATLTSNQWSTYGVGLNNIDGYWKSISTNKIDFVGLVHITEKAPVTKAKPSHPVEYVSPYIYQSNFYHLDRGGPLNNSLIGKRTKQSEGHLGVGFIPLNRHGLMSWGSFKVNDVIGAQPKHEPISLFQKEGSAVKALTSIIEKNGLLYLQFHGSELQYQNHDVQLANSSISQSYTKGKVYRFSVGEFNGLILQALTTLTGIMQDVTYINEEGELVGLVSGNVVFKPVNAKGSWGDDQTIPIISGENTKTDLNGNTVKVFCHHTLFPIGIAHNG